MSWTITPQEKTPLDQDYRNVSLLLHGNGSNGSTTITDNSPTPKTVNVFGDAQISTAIANPFAQTTGVIAFDGSGDYLSITSNNFELGAKDFTIEFWVYFPSGFTYSQGMAPISIIDGGNAGVFSPFSIRNSSGLVTSYIWGNSAWSIATGREFTTIQKDKWLHWAITRSGANWYLFENGTTKSQFTSTESVINHAGNASFLVARTETDSIKYVACYIDELRVTLDAARYTANFAPPTAPFPDAGPAQ